MKENPGPFWKALYFSGHIFSHKKAGSNPYSSSFGIIEVWPRQNAFRAISFHGKKGAPIKKESPRMLRKWKNAFEKTSQKVEVCKTQTTDSPIEDRKVEKRQAISSANERNTLAARKMSPKRRSFQKFIRVSKKKSNCKNLSFTGNFLARTHL